MTRTLSVFQSLWAMEGLPWRAPRPWTLEERIERTAEAGFAGVGLDLYAREAPAASEVAPLLRAAGLRSLVTAFVNDRTPLAASLEYAAEVGAELVVVCGQVFPDEPAEAAELVREWRKETEAAGFAFHLETHRYTLTNDLAFTHRLAAELPDVALSLDLSHYVVGNELPDKSHARVDGMIGRLLSLGASLQGRVATREQVQVPLEFGQHAAQVERFRGWWLEAMRSWRTRAADAADLVFLCELGTTPYAITGADGEELSDRWHEALLLKAWAEELFTASASESTLASTSAEEAS
ncbi:sugar phosphate isomerase/epimerase [Streptomyces sp. PSKA54]|uniref:Sugar phosphate isomerase/epimerase n=1 Tax=Streptomyces himalayensis subsp. aureolus TaxID=2758039 RepID=A0A7W2HJ84_9ACTN|nr:TIM barrel protein [Streptomyces himalayensis]MBA4865813.1 sugar phosphate isomerase/epimerase [Streptomyces himalayensis subsp. aureolus]